MIFTERAPLEQHPAVAVDHAHRDRSMQQTLPVRAQLRGPTDLSILRIDQYHVFFVVVHPGAPSIWTFPPANHA
jgi:hypothetical protein